MLISRMAQGACDVSYRWSDVSVSRKNKYNAIQRKYYPSDRALASTQSTHTCCIEASSLSHFHLTCLFFASLPLPLPSLTPRPHWRRWLSERSHHRKSVSRLLVARIFALIINSSFMTTNPSCDRRTASINFRMKCIRMTFAQSAFVRTARMYDREVLHIVGRSHLATNASIHMHGAHTHHRL